MNQPDAIFIYVPGDGKLMMFGAHWRGTEWRNSEVIDDVAESDLQEFLAEMQSMGMYLLDARKRFDGDRPGMGTVMPILLIKKDFPVSRVIAYAAHMQQLLFRKAREMNNTNEAGL